MIAQQDQGGTDLWRMQRLVTVVQYLSLAQSLDNVMALVKQAARQLGGSDGATIVLRDNDMCHYADEDAISPLWKGQRFPMESCISGWVMLNRKPTVIEDIYADARIPHDVYRPTFVRSLIMVPIREMDPIGAIGLYWKNSHRSDEREILFVQALANSTAVAMENIRLREELALLSGAGAAPGAGQAEESLRETLQRIRQLEQFVKMCAWTRKIESDGKWVTVEEYLRAKFGISVTHGMSEDVLKALAAELGESA